MELRPGSQHSQNGFVGFLRKMLVHARKITRKRLLVGTDSAHDALETLVELRRHPNVSFIIQWNPPDVLSWRDRAFREGRLSSNRAKRRRVKTVIQELIYPAGRVIRSGRRLKLQFGRHCAAFQPFRSVYLKFCPG
ncbi:hypothetical protein FDQ92_03605 [Desulfoglaeba alkanexedens ALDC]|uniref:Transposase n=1 Tax=Desulfoglaeba alkanexedens ALDC TaxID=980445 RepID=A0A4P8L121_9BACT|nr:hypothetical protein [Desulfoglaeba alkanexedens]QCQ21344.1 hypothetical protein FDQ92_03605 [Desulfoglaeba alkanexedens ALDC]